MKREKIALKILSQIVRNESRNHNNKNPENSPHIREQVEIAFQYAEEFILKTDEFYNDDLS